jgi:hypothetical protein
LNGTPETVSYFSCDYSPANNIHLNSKSNNDLIHTHSKISVFKLNKRFHPENSFTVPTLGNLEVAIIYRIQTPLVHEDDPLTNYAFNSPSLRGPPSAV